MGISKPSFQKRVLPRRQRQNIGQLSYASNRGLQRYGKEPDAHEIVEVENRKTEFEAFWPGNPTLECRLTTAKRNEQEAA
jgi:hypothetical protein